MTVEKDKLDAFTRELDASQRLVVDAEKLNTVSLLAAGIAHEINNPLSGTIQSAQLLSRSVDTEHPVTIKRMSEMGLGEEQRELIKSYFEKRGFANLIDIIFDCNQRISKMVNILMTFASSKEVSTNAVLPTELTDQAIFLASQDNELRKQYDIKSVLISNSIADHDNEVLCDPRQFFRVLISLIKILVIASYKCKQVDPNFNSFIQIDFVRKNSELGAVQVSCNAPLWEKSEKWEPGIIPEKLPENTNNVSLKLNIAHFIMTRLLKGELTVRVTEDGKTIAQIILPLAKPWEKASP